MKETVLISAFMTRYLMTVSPNTTLDKVYDIFEKNNIHHLPVVDGEKLVGMISKIDVYKITHCINLFRSKSNEAYNEKLLRSLLSEEIMTKDVVVLSPSDTAAQAAMLFSQNKFHALPVVDDEKLVGIVSTLDLIELAFNEKMKPASY
jgi:acetoin utilization protein AcuB